MAQYNKWGQKMDKNFGTEDLYRLKRTILYIH